MILGPIIQDWANETKTEIHLVEDRLKKEIWVYSTDPAVLIGRAETRIYKYIDKIHSIPFYKEYNIKVGEIQETFYPGNDYNKILEERMNAFFEYEDYYSWFDEKEKK